ncbi:RNA methyltransferase [Patescibacteria group bacterium]|nr:RNA methyltransferase [Patescibacteria group bacterium]
MLSKPQNRLLLNLRKKKERERLGLFIIEGEKFVRDAKAHVEFVFKKKDTPAFFEVVSTESPQDVAAVARIPRFTKEQIAARDTVLILDGVQDPGNVGTLLRAALAFNASVILVESADPTNPKVVRSSAAAVVKVPWAEVRRSDIHEWLVALHRPIFRLEYKDRAITPEQLPKAPIALIAGSEGQGIRIADGQGSVMIPMDPALESLNVAMAVSIALYARSTRLDS